MFFKTMINNPFQGKTLEQIHQIIKKVGGQNPNMGISHGKYYHQCGFLITDKTPLWSEILEIEYINGFYKGFEDNERLTK